VTLQRDQNETRKSEGSLSGTIGRIAGVIGSDNFPTGERATLKRLVPGLLPSLTFYRFAFRHLPKGWEFQQPAWMTIVAGLALMCPRPHRQGRPAGRALAEAGYAESRLERLLAAEGEMLNTLLMRAVRFLAAKGESVNWTDFARLLLTRDRVKFEDIRLKIARDYYYPIREKE
jgi:CRISPR system Cascade subunit CasB